MVYPNPLRLISTIAIFLLISQGISAQEHYMETHVAAKLESILMLNVDPEIKIEFGISKVNDNLYQITKIPDDINFSVESTGNWNLSITASDPYFRGVNDPTQTIPIDFIGYHIENRGNNWDNGPFSNIANKTKDTTIALTSQKNVVLADGRKNNIGGASRNSFVLRWNFMYEEDLNKIQEFTNLGIDDDQFVGRFYITLSESGVSGSSISIPPQAEPFMPDQELPVISGTFPFSEGLIPEKEK